MQVKETAFFIFLIIFLSKLYFVYPITSDSFERMRISSEIIFSQKFPLIDTSSIPARMHLYPPLFDLFISSFSLLTALSVIVATDISSYIFSAIFILSLFKLTNSPLAPILAFSSPWIFHRFLTPISETMAISLLPSFIYLLKDWKKYILAFILLLIHIRTFVFATFVLLFIQIEKFGSLVSTLFLISSSIIFYFIPKFFNPLVNIQSIFDVLGPIMPFILPIIFISNNKLNKTIFLANLPTFFLMPNYFRQFLYFFMPATLSFNHLKNKWINLLLPSIVSIILLMNLAYYSPPTDASKISLIGIMSFFEGNTVASSYSDAYQISFYNKSVILGAFAENLPDFDSRYYDLNNILSGNLSKAEKYGINYIFTSKKQNLPLVAVNNNYYIYSLKNKSNATVA